MPSRHSRCSDGVEPRPAARHLLKNPLPAPSPQAPASDARSPAARSRPEAGPWPGSLTPRRKILSPSPKLGSAHPKLLAKPPDVHARSGPLHGHRPERFRTPACFSLRHLAVLHSLQDAPILAVSLLGVTPIAENVICNLFRSRIWRFGAAKDYGFWAAACQQLNLLVAGCSLSGAIWLVPGRLAACKVAIRAPGKRRGPARLGHLAASR